jgi:hypothetical protein
VVVGGACKFGSLLTKRIKERIEGLMLEPASLMESEVEFNNERRRLAMSTAPRGLAGIVCGLNNRPNAQ